MEITPWWNRNVEELSKGMQQKVQFIITLIHKPSLLIFDEPFSGFDPINANILKEEILELKKKGSTVIFSTHNMASVEEICDEIMLINKSEKILQGPINNIKETYKKGEFRIECTDWNQELENTISKKCSLLDVKRNTNNFEILLRMPNKLSPSDEILKSLIGQTRIISFQEILPSMNEIFISEVNKNN
jgi:ABC-2 type transport system ATP-binding protein